MGKEEEKKNMNETSKIAQFNIIIYQLHSNFHRFYHIIFFFNIIVNRQWCGSIKRPITHTLLYYKTRGNRTKTKEEPIKTKTKKKTIKTMYLLFQCETDTWCTVQSCNFILLMCECYFVK